MNCMVNKECFGIQSEINVGRVKWYSPEKGYGFLISPNFDQDILLTSQVLNEFGETELGPETELEFLFSESDMGFRVKQVLSMCCKSIKADCLSIAEVASPPLEAARVSWFDETKKYGFARIFGGTSDIYLHASVLERSGLRSLISGEAIGLRVQETLQGLAATEIRPWWAGNISNPQI